MPRGRKKANYCSIEEQLTMTNEEIAKCEETLKGLKNKRKELEKTLKLEKLSRLNELIEKSGKSIDEISAMLTAE